MFAGVADFGIEDGSPNGIAVLPYTDQVLSDLARRRRAFDLVALHAYRFPPSLSPDDLGLDALPASARSGARTPGRRSCEAYEQEFTAHGYGTPRDVADRVRLAGQHDSAASDYFPSLQAQATDVAQAYQALESPALSFVQAAFWFNQRDYQPGMANPDPAFFAHYGLLFNNFAQAGGRGLRAVCAGRLSRAGLSHSFYRRPAVLVVSRRPWPS